MFCSSQLNSLNNVLNGFLCVHALGALIVCKLIRDLLTWPDKRDWCTYGIDIGFQF